MRAQAQPLFGGSSDRFAWTELGHSTRHCLALRWVRSRFLWLWSSLRLLDLLVELDVMEVTVRCTLRVAEGALELVEVDANLQMRGAGVQVGGPGSLS